MRLVHSNSTTGRNTYRNSDFTCDRCNVLCSIVRIPVRLRIDRSFTCA